MNAYDNSQRFLFDDTDIRGEIVCLRDSYAHVLAKHSYPEPVAELLGEMLAAAALLVGTLKFNGLLVLQARSSGAIPLLMVECSSNRELRGIARYHAEQIGTGGSLAELMPDGALAVTVDPAQGQRYQGIVALDGINLSECLSSYFATSEQLPTRFWLHADGRTARGLLLQQLPADRLKEPEERAASWQHMTVLADSLTAEERRILDKASHEMHRRGADGPGQRNLAAPSVPPGGGAVVRAAAAGVPLQLLAGAFGWCDGQPRRRGCTEIDRRAGR